MVKVSKPGPRHALSTFQSSAPDTITAARGSHGGTSSPSRPGRTLLLDKEEVLARCERLKVTLLAVE